MNERKLRRFCVAVVAFAIALRLAGGARLRPEAERTVEVWPVRILAARNPPEESAPEVDRERETREERALKENRENEPQENTVQAKAEYGQKAAETAAARLEFSAEEAEKITIGGAQSFTGDKLALLTRPSSIEPETEGPKVLIVHTHSSEAYTQEAGWEYDSSDPLRTGNVDRSVIRIGTRLAEILNEHGIQTLHDTALNDYPLYSGAYERMRVTIEAYLEAYPSIQMVLDIHRDAAEDVDGMPVAFSTEVDGAQCAQLMLVVGTDGGGLSHPDWEENLANALKLQALLNRDAPGLCRDLDLRTERFNQHETPGSLLVEFGCTGNTLLEALRSAEYLGQALCAFWDGLAAEQAG